MRPMKKLITRFVSFLVVALLSYSLLVFLWAHFVPFGFLKKNLVYPKGGKGFTHSRLIDIDTVQNVDVLFLGSSHAFRGFDPRIFAKQGIRTFNLGSPSQTPFQTGLLLEKYLDQLNPKLVIYEVYPATFQNDGVESSLDLMANSDCLNCSFQMATGVNHIKAYNTLIYDIFAETLGLDKGFHEPLKKGTDAYVPGGYVESAVLTNQSPVTEKMRQSWDKDTWEITDMQWSAFLNNLEMLEERAVSVELIQMPVSRAALALYKNNDFVDSTFHAQGSYHNFNHVLTLDDDRDFMDYHHLSQTGVNKANAELLSLLKRLGHFKDRIEPYE